MLNGFALFVFWDERNDLLVIFDSFFYELVLLVTGINAFLFKCFGLAVIAFPKSRIDFDGFFAILDAIIEHFIKILLNILK